MEINGNSLPTKIMSLVENGLWWELPEEKDYLDTIYKGPVNSLKDLELYDLSVMKFETEGLIENCKQSEWYKERFLAEPDKEYVPGDIDWLKAIVIGDLGIGSDTPIVLDYRGDKDNPSVLLLHWFRSGNEVKTRWLKIADTFDEFWEAISIKR